MALGTLALTAGCADVAVREHVQATDEFARRESGVGVVLIDSPAAQQASSRRVRELLQADLTEAGAIEVALRYSPSYQQVLAESIASTASATQSARLPNPVFEYARLASGDVSEIDRAVRVSLLEFLLLPQRRQLAALQQRQHRLRSAGNVVDVIAATRQAWIDAVAAAESARYAEQVHDLAIAAAETARRMAAVGAFSKIERYRQESFAAEAVAELARARLEATAARETLIRHLGLAPELAPLLKLPEQLPDLPAAAHRESEFLERAFAERLDVALARAELDYTARALGLTRITSSVNAIEIGAASNSAPQEPTLRGPTIEWRLPLFDFGDARRANARGIYLAALNRAAQVAVDARSHVRESYEAYRTAYDLARHYREEVVPLRRAIAEENLLRYNGMLISVFELLADSREQIAAVRQSIAAQRDYWRADAALRASMIGRPVEAVALGSPAVIPGAGTSNPH